MFNQNSTSSERRAFLMAILDTENDEDEVMYPFCMFMLCRKNCLEVELALFAKFYRGAAVENCRIQRAFFKNNYEFVKVATQCNKASLELNSHKLLFLFLRLHW